MVVPCDNKYRTSDKYLANKKFIRKHVIGNDTTFDTSLLSSLPSFSSTSSVQMRLTVMMDILGPLEREDWELEKKHLGSF